MPIDESIVRTKFEKQFKEINSNKWFIKDFVAFQYGELRDNNPLHNSVIKKLTILNLTSEVDIGYSTPVNNNIKGLKRLDLFKKFNFRCIYCEKVYESENLQPDHILSLKHGGDNSTENLVCVCRDCNIKKSDKDLLTFVEEFNLDKKRILQELSSRGIQAPKEGAKVKVKVKVKGVVKGDEPTIEIATLVLKTSFLEQKKAIYPMLDIEGEIRKCADWFKTKGMVVKSWEQTITNWLKKAYDQKGVVEVKKTSAPKNETLEKVKQWELEQQKEAVKA